MITSRNLDKEIFRKLIKNISFELMTPFFMHSEFETQDNIICQKLSKLVDRQFTNDLIMFYFPAKDEVKINNVWTKWGREFCLPAMAGKEIVSKIVRSNDKLISAGWGHVKEPSEQASPADLARISAIVVPGRAFDKKCRRLGRGKAHYDTFLAKLPATTYKIGVAYRHQIFESIPVEAHDVSMDLVITADTQIRV